MTPDPFEILGLPARFDLNPAAIEAAYLARVASVHPDLASSDPGAAAAAARESAKLNDARRRLVDPELRTRALLARLAPGAAGEPNELPDGFLMEIMETRMEIEAAAASGDQREIRRWREWAKNERSGYVSRLGSLFSDASSGSDVVDGIRRELNAWRYIERLLEQLPASELRSDSGEHSDAGSG